MKVVRRLGYAVSLAFFLLLVAIALPSDVYPPRKVLEQRIELLTVGKQFSIVGWELNAIAGKAWQFIRGTDLTDGDVQTVREFFDVVAQIGRLRDEADRLAAQQLQMSARAAEIQTELKSLYEQRDGLENDAEDVLALQVTQALSGNELHTRILLWNVVWPPVTSEFVDLPLLLVISPRNHIERRAEYLLDSDLTVAEMEAIEDAIQGMNFSALVTRIGGLATYPAMIPEIYGLGFVLDTMPHEWVHDFLWFYPLGWLYGTTGEITTMNETVADIVGEEIGQWLARAYYPEYVREPQPKPTPAPSPAPEPTELPA
jgi:hypothetical protein